MCEINGGSTWKTEKARNVIKLSPQRTGKEELMFNFIPEQPGSFRIEFKPDGRELAGQPLLLRVSLADAAARLDFDSEMAPEAKPPAVDAKAISALEEQLRRVVLAKVEEQEKQPRKSVFGVDLAAAFGQCGYKAPTTKSSASKPTVKQEEGAEVRVTGTRSHVKIEDNGDGDSDDESTSTADQQEDTEDSRLIAKLNLILLSLGLFGAKPAEEELASSGGGDAKKSKAPYAFFRQTSPRQPGLAELVLKNVTQATRKQVVDKLVHSGPAPLEHPGQPTESKTQTSTSSEEKKTEKPSKQSSFDYDFKDFQQQHIWSSLAAAVVLGLLASQWHSLFSSPLGGMAALDRYLPLLFALALWSSREIVVQVAFLKGKWKVCCCSVACFLVNSVLICLYCAVVCCGDRAVGCWSRLAI